MTSIITSIIRTVIPVTGFATMVAGRITTVNQIIEAVTVIQSKYAGTRTIAGFAF
jgi:hypothetical protein